MKQLVIILLLVSFMFLIIGCSNPYLNPDISKALTEKEQFAELQKQNVLLERQTIALEKIASILEKGDK